MHSPCDVNDCAVAPCASRAPRVAQKLDGVRGACVLRVPFSRSPFLPITHARTHAIVPRKSDIPYHDGFANQKKKAPIFTYRPIHTPFASSGQAAPALAAQHPVSPRFFRRRRGFFFLERSFFSFSPHTTTSRVAHGGLGAPEFVPEFARCRKSGCAAAAKETPDCVFS